jgi:hypothetical protein
MPGKVKSLRVHRVIDANYNRAKEGLRVCEDIFRFVEDDKALTARIKKVRHGLTAAVSLFGLKDIVAARDITGDVGRATIKAESCRKNIADIFYANSQRVKESLRVLEEFAKLEDAGTAAAIKKLRYSVYDIEKLTLKKI